jgi:uncharacterized protein YkwD
MRRAGSKLIFVAILIIPPGCSDTGPDGDEGGLVISTGWNSETGASSGADGSTTDDSSSTTGNPTATTGDPSTTTTGDLTTTTGDPSTTGNPNPDNLPAWCDPTLSWDPTWTSWEEEVLVIMNQRRSEGANCGSEGSFPSAGPLTMQANLTCAARMHSKDMYDRDFFDHTNPDGDGPGERIDDSGYDAWGWGENIAWGQNSPAAVMQAWMDSDGHCSNIMNGSFTEVGVGWYTGDQWTQVFGTPAG